MNTHRYFCEDAFPFLLEVDADLRVCHMGPLMQRLLPKVRNGDALWEVFRVRSSGGNPPTFDGLCQMLRRNTVMDTVGTEQPLVFRGEWYRHQGENSLVFLGWPWVLDSEELARLGLTLADFPAHTPLGDMLVLLRSNQNTLADTRELAERLHQRTKELRQTNQQLEQLAHFDTLTQMPNRVLLADRLRHAMAQCQRRSNGLAVVYLDLDGFKPINDRYGHSAGDQLLTVLAQRLKEMLREGDTLARIGGDEFVAVLGDLQRPQDCEPVLERLLQAARMPVVLGDTAVQVSASVGITFYPQDPVDADLLLRHADQAMYLAKQSGKNRWHVFDLAHDAAIATRHESLEEIRQALQHQQFVLHYQPQVDLVSGRVLGVEALIRWQHPLAGLRAPATFLPLVEDHPLGFSLGEWVLHTALAQLATWNREGLSLQMSVNLDPAHLQSEHFAQRLRDMLALYPGVRPHQLTLEVLESCAMQDMERAESVLRQCHAMGVRCALDDFGTGYSSLVYLKRLSAGTVKIDRSFVMGMLAHADDRAIVHAVISLARAFGREVVAEGVESADHARALRSMGCTQAQGFGIARPMPAHAVSAWIRGFLPDPLWYPQGSELLY